MKNTSLIVVAAVVIGFVLVFRGQLGNLLSPGGTYLTGVGPIPPGASTHLLPMPVPPGGFGSPLSPIGSAISSFTSSLASAFGRTSATGQASAGPPATPTTFGPPAVWGTDPLTGEVTLNGQLYNPDSSPSVDSASIGSLPLTLPSDFSSLDLGSISPGLADTSLSIDPSLSLPDSVIA